MKRHRTGPFGVRPDHFWYLGFTSGSVFDCLLGVLMHARIDALMHPRF